MGKSKRLRLQDVRCVFRLVGECRDLGWSSVLWRRHALEGLCRLLGAKSAVGTELVWQRPQLPRRLVQIVDVGFTPKEQAVVMEYMSKTWPDNTGPLTAALVKLTGRHVTRTRTQMIEDRPWYTSLLYEVRRAAGVDHDIHSMCQISANGETNYITLDRTRGERDFSPLEQRLLHMFQKEVGRLIGPVLARASEPDPMQLSPRLRQTLDCLLDGDSEKQAALRLKLSPTTIHEYVTTLYRYFQVNSRGELLACFLKRVRFSELGRDRRDQETS